MFISPYQWWDVAKPQVEVFCRQSTPNKRHYQISESSGDGNSGALAFRGHRRCFKSVTEMDAPSKYFFALEQKSGWKRFLNAERTESGGLVSELTEICKQTVSFYLKLY